MSTDDETGQGEEISMLETLHLQPERPSRPMPPPPPPAARANSARPSSPGPRRTSPGGRATAPSIQPPSVPPSMRPSAPPARPSKGLSKAPPTPAPRTSKAPPPMPPAAGAKRHNTMPAEPLALDAPDLGGEALIGHMRAELGHKPEPDRAARLHYDLGVLYEGGGDFARAADHYRKATELRPDHVAAIQGARRCLSALSRHADSLPLFDAERRVCALPAERARLAFDKGRVLEWKLERHDDALATYREGLALEPQNLELLRAAARVERRTKRWDELDETLEKLATAIEHDPVFRAAVIAERARIHDTRKKDSAQAAELYFTAMALDPDVAGAAEAIKRLGHAQGHHKHLLEVYEQEAARTHDPEIAAAAHARMADLLADKLGEIERAIVSLQTAATERPRDRALLSRLAELYAASGRPTEQLTVLERLRALTRDPSRRAALSRRMGMLAEQTLDDPKRAETAYLAGLEDDPHDRTVLDALIALYARRGDDRGRLTMLARQLELETDARMRADVLFRMGDLLERGPRELEQAAEHYRKALGHWPDHEGALRALDRLLPALGRFAELVQVYEQLIDHLGEPEQIIAYLLRIGAIYEDRLDEPAGALSAYERVLRISPDHPAALHAVQRVAIRAGEFDRALRALQREAELTDDPVRAADLQYRAAELLAERLDNPHRAIALLERLLSDMPSHELATARLDALYRRERQWDDLLALLERRRAATEGPKASAAIALEMGRLCEGQLGRFEDAVTHYARALDDDPDHPIAFELLVCALTASAKWPELSQTLENRAKNETDPAERARLYCDLGQLREERLGDPTRAVDAYTRALDAMPGHRPAIDARSRLLWARGDLPRLAKALHEEAESTAEPWLALEALQRAASVEADLMGDARAALATYRAILERSPRHASALLAIEPLCIELRERDALTENYGSQATATDDDRLKAAALRDLSRMPESPEDVAAAYSALIALRPDDREALSALAQYARTSENLRMELSHRAHLASVAGDPGVASMQHLTIATQIEQSDPMQALAAFRTALALDPDSQPATRGLSRVALALGLPDALTEAARNEARITRDLALAVELLLQAADLRQRRGDFAGASADAQRALDYDPGHARAAGALITYANKTGEAARLAELLARAAERTEDVERRADLYTQVARIRADRMRDLNAAISAAERARSAKPDHAPALALLAGYLEMTGQWERAAEMHEKRADAAREPADRAAAHLAVASIAVQHLRDRVRAQKSLRVVLALDADNRKGLALQARIYAEAGKHAEALALARKLVETARDDGERALALLELARGEEREGRPEEAEQALHEALRLEGPDSDAECAYRERIGEHASWPRYIDALEQHLHVIRERGGSGGKTVRAIARAQAEGLGDRAAAITSLQQGSRLFPDDVELWIEYASQLVANGQPDPAIAIVRGQLARTPDHPELWQALSAAHAAAGRPAEAMSAALPLLVLDAVSGEERVSLQMRVSHPAEQTATVNDVLIRELDPRGALLSPAAVLTQTLSPVLCKLRPVELAEYGLSRRDRLPEESDHALRLAVDRVSRLLGGPDCEVYIHSLEAPEVNVGLGEPPALLVPRTIAGQAKSRLVFELARRMFCLRYDLAAVDALPARELSILLCAAVRRQDPSYGAELADEGELEEASRALGKAIPWLSRKRIDDAASALANAGRVDLEGWCEQVQTVAARVSLLMCDDLPGALELLQSSRGQPTLVDPMARDLMQLWASELAVRYRQRLPG